MGYSLSRAAEVAGKGKSTIHRAIKNGKLSASRTDSGAWSIEPVELARAFPRDVLEQPSRDEPEQLGNPLQVEAAVLAVRVEMLEAQLGREQDTVGDLRQRLDRAEGQVLALTDQRASVAAASWWSRVFGRV